MSRISSPSILSVGSHRLPPHGRGPLGARCLGPLVADECSHSPSEPLEATPPAMANPGTKLRRAISVMVVMMPRQRPLPAPRSREGRCTAALPRPSHARKGGWPGRGTRATWRDLPTVVGGACAGPSGDIGAAAGSAGCRPPTAFGCQALSCSTSVVSIHPGGSQPSPTHLSWITIPSPRPSPASSLLHLDRYDLLQLVLACLVDDSEPAVPDHLFNGVVAEWAPSRQSVPAVTPSAWHESTPPRNTRGP